MRNLVKILLLVLSFTIALAASAESDPYSEILVSKIMRAGVTTSFDEKATSSLGDRAAVALIRLTADSGFGSVEEAKKALWVLRTAFSVPQNIAERADHQPRAALFLLLCISKSPLEKDLSQDIDSTRRVIISSTQSAPPSEP